MSVAGHRTADWDALKREILKQQNKTVIVRVDRAGWAS